jgi:hypothetical protein
MKSALSLIVLAAVALLPTAVYAQDDDGARGGMKATAIVGEGGLSQDGSRNSGWWGGMALWQPTHRVGIGVSSRWIDAGPAASGFAADISTELALVSKSSRDVPYVRLGVGAYRATFDVAGRTQLAAVPDFYRRRLGTDSTVLRRETFMDPAFVVAAGMDVPLGAHVSVRPDVRGMWVVRGGHTYQMVLVGVQLAYHIEEHPVTPSRGSR